MKALAGFNHLRNTHKMRRNDWKLTSVFKIQNTFLKTESMNGKNLASSEEREFSWSEFQ